MFAARGVEGSTDFAGKFNGGFVGFAAGVAEENFACGRHAAGGEGVIDEEFGEGADPGIVVEIGYVD